jgi:polysaccharide export outer membrane protein
VAQVTRSVGIHVKSASVAGLSPLLLVAAVALAGCTRQKINPVFASGDVAARAFGTDGVPAPASYRIAPTDVLRVQVFNEADLSVDRLQVSPSGEVMLPLAGTLRVAGLTETEVASEVRQRLSRYLQKPDVTVNVIAATRQRVVVEGFVTEPGVFDIAGSATLLEVIARAKSPTNRAAIEQIVVIRMINGKRYGAVFNLKRIRAGLDPDPTILGGDRVVVGYSALRGALREFLSAAPILAVFRPI